MGRAKRHHIPGYIWHITHRCHKREFPLKFSKDRHRYLQRLYQARKRYGLMMLNYMVTSNHAFSSSMMGTGTRSLIQCNWRLDERGRNTIRGRKNSLTLSKPLANLFLNHPQGALNGLLAPVGSRSSGFFLWTNLPPTENRVLFLTKAIDFIVDGFNLYHSARQAAWKLRIPTKWLNIHALCSSFIHIASRVLGEKTELRNIYYFSALADHLEDSHPGITRRHKAFLKCLEDTGVIVELSRFKAKEIKCPHPQCGRTFVKHEEKETDVAIALKLIEVFLINECDAVFLMTGDTDLVPAVRTAHRLFPDKRILFAFPPYRKNRELAKLAPGSFSFKTGQFVKHQFSNPYTTKFGLIIRKPSEW